MPLTRLAIPLLLLAACNNSLAPPSSEMQQRAIAIIDTLETIDMSLLEEAFAEGLRRPHIQHWMDQRRTPSNVSMHSRQLHVDAGGAVTQVFGLGQTARETNDVVQAINSQFPNSIIPEDPAYLSDRFRDEFVYRVLPDTLYWGRPVQVIEVEARPGSRQDLRHVRFYMDRETGALIDYRLTRQSSQILYSEDSRYRVSLRPEAGGGWRPHQISIKVVMHLPPARARMITRDITFADFES